MRLLLDTQVFLWFVTADATLPPRFRDAIQDAKNEVFLSVASVWEAVVKHGLGKLPLPGSPAEYLPRQRRAHSIASLPVEEDVLASLANLPLIHRDPFDRIMVAQAIHHDLVFVTADGIVKTYPVKLLDE